ncbi:MAG: flagellar basal-body MS-ring/collar protein FliF [Gammaproteobacteria bacterium]|nr:flagellar basal-body MS-ring/collar protein FliF [Gammaproteobacteria bacterium]
MAVPAENLPQNPNAAGRTDMATTDLDTRLPVDTMQDYSDEDLTEKPMVARFRALSRRQQMQLVIGVAAAFTVIIAIFMYTTEKNYELLYAGLSQQSSADIVQVLDQEGIPYQLDDKTGEIKVPGDKVHEVRLRLATQGLPQQEGTGFEMLAEQQGFGTSQFMEQARYHKAIEGELARSITAMSSIESARVHLAIPKQSVFIRDRKEPTASVMVKLGRGLSLDESQVAAIVHLVASSIPELKSDNVTVVDERGRMLTKRHMSGDMALSSAQFDFKQKMEEYYIHRIERILTPVVGFEALRAQVDADIDFTMTESTAEKFNPDLPSIRSEQTVREESRGGDVSGVPGALTNQPPGAGEAPETLPADGKGASQAPSKKSDRSTFNYELDKTISHTRKAPGTLKRLSVAVVMDDKVVVGADGSVARATYSPEEIESIRSLVREAVGFSEQRGDSLNIINAAFQISQDIPPAPSGPLWEQPWFIDLAKQGVGVLAVLVIILLVVRPVIRAMTTPEEVEEEEQVQEDEGSQSAEDIHYDPQRPGGLSLEDWAALGVSHEEYQRMLEVLRKMVNEDPRIVAQVVKTWLALDEEED